MGSAVIIVLNQEPIVFVEEIMSRLTDSKLGEITQRLVRELDPHQIWLFGSHAWGQPDDDSDVDLLVIVDRSDEPGYRLAQRAYQALYGVRFPCDVIVHTRQEVERARQVTVSLLRKIVENGRVLYG
jgi:predicted nucleotidyltransferase